MATRMTESAGNQPAAPRTDHWLGRFLHVRTDEVAAVLWSGAYFFFLLCGYYVLRPVRDEMGVQAGLDRLPWLFSAVFGVMLAVVPLFGWISARFPRRRFLPLVYLFFVANLGIFWGLFASGVAIRETTMAFFVWVSVFNLFVVSVFWSFMADLYDTAQARRLYGFIAAGGTAGAIAGPALTAFLARPLGPVNLLLVSASFLLAAIACIHRLGRWSAERAPGPVRSEEAPIGGGVLAGVRLVAASPYLLGISLYVVLYSTTSTLLYFQQMEIVPRTVTSGAERTALFAALDLAVNLVTLALQLLVFQRFLARLGLSATLAVIPLVSLAGFGVLSLHSTLAVLVVFGVLRRAGEFALAKPARETLFNVLGREEKYKAKNFMDTVVFRGGDTASGWLATWLRTLGAGMAGIALFAMPLAALWGLTGIWLARRHTRLRAAAAEPAPARDNEAG
jgi:AAA family ATP:ADP antiporter